MGHLFQPKNTKFEVHYWGLSQILKSASGYFEHSLGAITHNNLSKQLWLYQLSTKII